MPKIAFLGAGSMVFATKLVGDVLSFEELSDSTISLMDVDERRLDRTATVAEAMVANEDLDATIEATTDRRAALEGADYVLNTINVGGTESFETRSGFPRSTASHRRSAILPVQEASFEDSGRSRRYSISPPTSKQSVPTHCS